MKSYLQFFTFILFFSSSFYLNAQTIKLDSSFGENGVVKQDFQGNRGLFTNVLELDDGSFILLSFILGDSNNIYTSLYKYTAEGELDITYDGGIVEIPQDDDIEVPPIITEFNDGSIAVSSNIHVDSVTVFILTPDGEIVTEFNYNIGHHEIKGLSYKDDFIYIGGNTVGNESIFIIKTDLTGKLDTTYGDNGIFYLNDLSIENMKFQDDKLLIVGRKFLTRLLPNNQIDTSFGVSGYVNHDEKFSDASIQFDQQENIYISSIQKQVVLKLDKDGKIDSNYGIEGFAHYLNDEYKIETYFTRVTPEGEISLFGLFKNDANESHPIILRYNPLGQIDSSFGNNGLLLLPEFPKSVFIDGIINTEGDIVAAGSTNLIESLAGEKLFLVKFTTTPSSTNDILAINSSIEIFPNPAVNKIYILNTEQEDILELDIYDMFGKQVKHEEMKGRSTIDVSSLKSGIYILTARTKSGLMSKKIIKL